MSFFDSASLVQIPSGVKDGVLYSVKPIDGSGDLTFSRGSDIEATRVNANGYIEKAKVNLLLQSNQFDTSWTNSNSTDTGGQADKDGGTTAWKIDKTAANGYIRQAISQSGVQTFSVYAKAGTLNWMRLIADGGTSTPSTWFDLQNGVVGAADFFTIDANIESVGNGYYRCSISYEVGTIAGVRIYPADDNNDVSGTSGNIYIQDSQLNYGLVAQEYQETTTTSVVAGITNDMPRLDYSGGASCPSLLLEPSRTNLFPYSNYFGTDWGLTNATITTNATTSPEGINNASLYTSSNVANSITDVVTAANGTYTLSAFFKRDATDNVRMNFSDGVTGEIRYVFNLTDETSTLTKSGGSISDYSADFENYGNGWYRLHITATTNSGTAITAYFETDNETGSFYLYGAQCELGNYPTSMIPTYGTSATRTADACSKTGISSLIGQTEGTLFVEFEIGRTPTSTDRVLILNDGTGNERIGISLGATGLLYAFVVDGGATQAEIVRSSTTAGTYKAAFAYKANDFVFYVNGVQVGTDTAGTIPSCSRFDLGQQLGVSELGGSVKQAILFTSRLSNSDLAALTQ
jgi:hypothetical protein